MYGEKEAVGWLSVANMDTADFTVTIFTFVLSDETGTGFCKP